MSDGSTLYFVAGAPRSNHSGQVIVYTVNFQKQSTIIDSERGKQVLTFEDLVFIWYLCLRTKMFTCGLKPCKQLITGKQAIVVLDWVILWKCAVLPGCG